MIQLIASLLLTMPMVESESFVEATSQVIYNSTSRSQFSLEYRSVIKPDDIYYVTTCGYQQSFLNHQSFYVGAGLRRPFAGGYIGAHVVMDYAYIAEVGYGQFGPTFEYLSDSFDVKAHYYRPFEIGEYNQWYIISPAAYADAKIVYKMSDLKLFMKPSIKIKNPEFGLICGVSVPFERFEISLQGGRNDYYQNHFMIRFDFLLFSTCERQTVHQAVDRHRGFRFSISDALKKSLDQIKKNLN